MPIARSDGLQGGLFGAMIARQIKTIEILALAK
jgi:hypothetical protein